MSVQRIKWAGHVVRIDENGTTKMSSMSNQLDTQRKGMPNLKLIDGLEKDLLVSRTKNWRTLAGSSLAWEILLDKTKAYPGPSSHCERKGIFCKN
ncbi:uncharacterized protein TNCV_2252851 [Trichonephila clavipes]|nr:uncharacterized protein TNCV_2252851 [Trichonephila clavipes]